MDLLETTDCWSIADVQKTCEMAALNGCGTIVVDSHESTPEYLRLIRSAGFYVISRDDLSLSPFPCQMVINGNLDAENLSYKSSSGDTQFLLGTKYMVLGKQFEEQTPRLNSTSVKNVLVILGGADPRDLMPRLLSYLDNLPEDFKVTAVIGDFFGNIASVESSAKSANRPVRLVYSPPSIFTLMAEADLTISAAGQTLYELACVGCPTVAFSIAANQKTHLAMMEDTGVLVSAGDADVDDVVSKSGMSLSTLMADNDKREAMTAAGQKLIDGKGAQRVARKIVSEIRA